MWQFYTDACAASVYVWLVFMDFTFEACSAVFKRNDCERVAHRPKMKKMTPRDMATAEMIKMNLWISMESGVSADSAEEARLAI